MISNKRIEELKSMGFARYGTHNYPGYENGRQVIICDRKNPVRSKISVKHFGRTKFGKVPIIFGKHPLINSDPIGEHKTKRLFYNVWFDTPEEAWEAADYFVDNFVLPPEVLPLFKRCEEIEKEKELILKQIRKIRKSKVGLLEKIIKKWQWKEKF